MSDNPTPPSAGSAKPTFTDRDTEKLVELLNFIALHGKFNGLEVKQILQFTKLLNWAQTELLPKVDAHKFEVISVKPLGKKK